MVHFVALERLVNHFLTLKNNSINFLVLIFVLGMVIKLEICLVPKIQSLLSDYVVVVKEGLSVHKISLISSTLKWRNIFNALKYSVIGFHVVKLTLKLYNFLKIHSYLILEFYINWKMLVAYVCRLTFLLSPNVSWYAQHGRRQDFFIQSISFHAYQLMPLSLTM